jgi:hypothetical protein
LFILTNCHLLQYFSLILRKKQFTGIWEDEIAIPSGLIDVGEEFHICIEDTRKDIILACYELENGSESEPEHLEIDFNNFP